MGLWDKIKGTGRESKRNSQAEAYQNMVELLAVDADTAEKLNELFQHPQEYYDANAASYEERGVDSGADDDTIIWLGIVDVLIAQGKMYEFDYSVELEDFVYGIKEITVNDTLSFDESCLDEDSDITEWLEMLYNEWIVSGVVVAGMDIDSDSYCVFITGQDTFDRLVSAAEKTGHTIALAHDM